MVATRRSTVNETSPANGTYITQSEEDNDTIHVQRPHPRNLVYVPTTPKFPKAVLNITLSSTGGMEDISLTSAPVGESLRQEIMTTPKRKQASPIQDRTLSSALRRLVAKPGPTKGSARNPIILEEYSPRRKPVRLPARKENLQEPHKFQDRHRKLYTYHPPLIALAPKPTKRSTFTGDKNNDIYRMMNAKMTAVDWTRPAVCGISNYGMPFEVRYPMSAQYLAQKPTTDEQSQLPYVRYHRQMGVYLTDDSEDMLRKKATQYVRESAQLQSRKKKHSNDLDPMSTSKTEPAILPQTPSSRRKLVVHQDANDHVTSLIAQTSLLTSLLQIYPRSTDQKGLREDIAMLVSAQNQEVAEWMKADSQLSRKRRRCSNNDSAINVDSDADWVGKEPDRIFENNDEASKKDEEVRSLLSAGADMWQDGSGEGVVDVFGIDNGQSSGPGVTELRPARGSKRRLGVCARDIVM
jgi:hypothetical protein